MDVVKRKLELVDMKVWMAFFVVFSFVCSGGFGIEDMVGGAGPGFALILLIALPFLWGLPQSLVCSELGAAIPEDGGLYRWSRRALGEFMGFQTGWWWVLSIFVDSAVYIALTVDYAKQWFGLTGMERWLLAVVLIAIFAYVNIRGLQLASWMLFVLQIVVFVPFVALAVLGIAKWHGNPFHPFLLPGVSLIGGVGVALSVGIWMYSGFESLSTMAGEIKRPQHVIPRALMITLPVVLVFYVSSTMGGIAAVGHPAQWGTSGVRYDFMGVGLAVGGQLLRHLFFAAMLAGNFALFLAFLAAGARPSYVLSKDRLLPRFLGKESRYGTPWLAILLMAGVDAVLVRWGFATLIVIDVFLLMLAHITIYISAVVLRVRQPDLERPFRIPLGTGALAAMCAVPVTVAVLAISPFGNGWNYFIGGSIAAVTGPPAYFVFKHIYKGRPLPEIGYEYADDETPATAAGVAPAVEAPAPAPSAR